MTDKLRSQAQQTAMRDVLSERDKQDAKWGIQVHDFPLWMTILGEEFGELCQETLERNFVEGKPTDRIYAEATQVAAVALRIMEQIEESKSHG